MTLRPAEFLGLPPGLSLVPAAEVTLRYAVALLVVAWAVLLARGRRMAAALAGAAVMAMVLAFWAAAFGRPYGLLVEGGVTRRAAQAAVAHAGDSFLVGAAGRWTAAASLVRAGLPADLVIALPTLAPVLLAPALGLAVFFLWPVRPQAALAASLWLAFSTSEAQAVRGAGFLPGLWSHPREALLVLALAVLALGLERLRLERAVTTPLMIAVVCAGLLVSGRGPAPPWPDRLMLASFDEMPWLLLAAAGSFLGAPFATRVLAVVGGGVFLLGRGGDAWAAEACYHLGLLLASVPAVEWLAGAVDEWLHPLSDRGAPPVGPRLHPLSDRGAPPVGPRLRPPSDRARPRTTRDLAPALLTLLLVPGAFLARWRPPGLDPVAFASLDSVPTNLQAGMEWVREETPVEAVFVASPEYAPFVPVLGQRRVLRAPTLVTPDDDFARQRLEQRIVAGPIARSRLERHRVDYLLFAGGDLGWLGVRSTAVLDANPGLRLRYQDRFLRVYELVPL